MRRSLLRAVLKSRRELLQSPRQPFRAWRRLLGSQTNNDVDKLSKQGQSKDAKSSKESKPSPGAQESSGNLEDTNTQNQAEEPNVHEEPRRERTPLPPVNRNNPELEFVTRTQYETTTQSFIRRNIAPMQKVLGEVWSLIASKETFYIVSGAGFVLFTVGANEALLCLRADVPTFSADALHFIWSYSKSQILPSFIWSTTPADLICQSIGIDASHMLRTFDHTPHEESMFGGTTGRIGSAADASRQLSLISLQCLRSVLAQSILLANVLNAVNRVVKVNNVIEQRVLDGAEPFPSGVREKIIRFCGVMRCVAVLAEPE